MNFEPNDKELKLIQQVLERHPAEFAVVRLTETMLHKAIIDASALIRPILKDGLGIDYENIDKGPEGKQLQEAIVFGNFDINYETASFYRPLTKNGDPRLWIYGLKKYSKSGDMILLTTHNNKLIVIPLLQSVISNQKLKKVFGDTGVNKVKDKLFALLTKLNERGLVESVSPDKKYPKDVGDTLERELQLIPNTSKLADFEDKIELKAKRAGSKTNDTLFSMVPDWEISRIKSSNEMIRTHGYTSTKYPDFVDLYVTVSNKKNRQGLYLEVDEENGFLYQVHEDAHGTKTITCIWTLEEIKKRLFAKHPETVWVLAEETLIDNKYHFHFNQVVYTHTPIFASFLLLITKGIITYDWRGRVKPDGTEYKDKGHCFRIKPKYRDILFTDSEVSTMGDQLQSIW